MAPSHPFCAPMSVCLAQLRARLRRLVRGERRILVGVSGGPDSQALLDGCCLVAADLGLDVVACGIDHGLRADCLRELELAGALARRHGVPMVVRRLAALGPGNQLAQARAGRLRALRDEARRVGAALIGLGHHMGDQAETLLMHLVRGCGPMGLAGMPERRGPFIRPLLHTRRADILEHLEARGIAYATDPSNAVPERVRTKMRQVVLPALEQINSQAIAHLAGACARQRPLVAALRRRACRLVREAGVASGSQLCVAPLRRAPRQLLLVALSRWLTAMQLGFAQGHLDALVQLIAADGEGRQAICMRGGYVAKHGEWLIARPGRPTPGRAHAWPAGKLPLASLCERPTSLRSGGHGMVLWRQNQPPWPTVWSRRADVVAFAADALHSGVSLRPWQPGDKVRPWGRGGHALISDIFNQARVPRAMRPGWPLVVQGDEVLWVAGLQRSQLGPVRAAGEPVVWLMHQFCPVFSPSTPRSELI